MTDNELLHSHLAEFALAQCRLMESDKLRDSEGDCIQDKSFDAAFQKLLNHNRDYKLMFFCYKEDYDEVEESLRKYETQRYPISIYRFQIDPKTKAIEKDMQGYTLYRNEGNYPTTLQRRVRMSGGRLSRGQLSRAELAEFAYAYCRLEADGKLCTNLGCITGKLTSFMSTFDRILSPDTACNYTNDKNIIFCYKEHYPEVEYSLRKYEREYLPIRIFMMDIDPRTRQFLRDEEGYVLYVSRDYPDEEYPWKSSLKELRLCRAPDPYCVKNAPCLENPECITLPWTIKKKETKNPPTHTSRTSSAVSSPEE